MRQSEKPGFSKQPGFFRQLTTTADEREWMGIETISRMMVVRMSCSFVIPTALHNPVQLVQKTRL